MAPPRKIYVPVHVGTMALEDSFRVARTDSPFTFAATPAVVGQASGADETTARIDADAAEASARAAADASERVDRIAADNVETNARQLADMAEASARLNADSVEAAARAAGDMVAHFASLDFSGLPTTDPGGGKVWLKAGDLHVGA